MIRLDKVSFHYGGEHGSGEGVEAIDLSIGSGEFVVLCGRSGCGKTTVTRLINGLAPQFYSGEMKGTVEVGGVAVSTEPLSHTAALIGNVFQNPKASFLMWIRPVSWFLAVKIKVCRRWKLGGV